MIRKKETLMLKIRKQENAYEFIRNFYGVCM